MLGLGVIGEVALGEFSTRPYPLLVFRSAAPEGRIIEVPRDDRGIVVAAAPRQMRSRQC